MWVLVDGYSVLHMWTRFTTRKARQRSLEQQRDALTRILRQYADHTGYRVTVVFDGYAAKRKPEHVAPTHGIEILYSDAGKTADDVIERLVGQADKPSQILVVTSDNLERRTVESMGARSQSVEIFAMEAEATLKELDHLVRRHGPKKRGGHTKIGDAFD